ncbi:MAG: hypothetical protein KDC84_10775 [Crocinitomicaceae bacterium]|nr:hypothetical protein [Crocinitomicaceae bacterium]
MKKLMILTVVSAGLVLASCGGEEEKKADPTFCDCINAKGAPPAGCDKVIPKDISDEEFEKKYDECKNKK